MRRMYKQVTYTRRYALYLCVCVSVSMSSVCACESSKVYISVDLGKQLRTYMFFLPFKQLY